MNENKDGKEIGTSSDFEELKGFFPEEYDLSPDELVGKIDADSFDNNGLSPIWDASDIDSPLDVPAPPAKKSDISEAVDTPAEDTDVDEPKKAKKKHNLLEDVYDVLEMFVICTTVILLITTFFLKLTVVDGSSMNNTLTDGEKLIICDVFYTPQRGDIVVLQNISLDPIINKPLIKRIIAVGGETVDISREGIVTITKADGSVVVLEEDYKLSEPYLKSAGHYEVPEGCVFVMGDNRNGSTDSRDSRVGYVDERCIFGKVILRVTPANKFGAVE